LSDATEFINPNLHVILVHYPIALLVLGMLIECFSWLGWRRSGFRAAGRWMIFLGVLSAIPTAFAGLYALSDVARMGLDAEYAFRPWREVLAVSPLVHTDGGAAWEMAKRHAVVNGITTVALTVVVVAWVGASDAWRRRLYWPCLLLLIAGTGFVGIGAWHGGELVYRHGVGVEEGEAMEPSPVALGAPLAGRDIFALQTTTPMPPAAPAPAAVDPGATTALGPVVPVAPDPTAPTPSTTAPAAAATRPADDRPAATQPSVEAPAAGLVETPPTAPAVAATLPVAPAPATAPAAVVVEPPLPAAPVDPALSDPTPAATASPSPAVEEQIEYNPARELERYVPPLQAHVILAGLTVAIAMAALALSLRASNVHPEIELEPRAELNELAQAYGARPIREPARTGTADLPPPIALPGELSDLDIDAMRVSVIERHRVPSARFWLLTTLVGILTAMAGWWVLASDVEMTFADFDPRRLLNMVFPEDWRELPRRPLHVVTAGAIILLPLLLAIFARWAPRRRGVLLFFAFLLILAVAAQVWLGVLLMWDTPVGKVFEFNPSPGAGGVPS
jgi:uncharacterized membrane protein